MAIEIEIKAWIKEPQTIENRVQMLPGAEFVKDYVKRDIYYLPVKVYEDFRQNKGNLDYPVSAYSAFRLRDENGRLIVTAKKKQKFKGVEHNKEIEFSADDAYQFNSFANFLGYVPFIEKLKEGKLYRWNDFNIELSHVKNLGDFIEIESLQEENTNKPINHQKIDQDLHWVLSILKISEQQIEDEYYIDMLIKSMFPPR